MRSPPQWWGPGLVAVMLMPPQHPVVGHPPLRSFAMTFLVDQQIDVLADRFARDGFVVLPGFVDAAALVEIERSMTGLQGQLAAGTLDRARHGGDVYTAAGPGQQAAHPHYVLDVGRLSPAVHDIFHHEVVMDLLRLCLGGVEPWEFDASRGSDFGVVFQDARPGDGTAYSRIGWHTDHQAYPNSAFFPSIALTVHIDGTSPANGFLRVLPGSHTMSTAEMPTGFEKVPGEVALYCDPGDVLLHHCDLWHAAARATEDPPGGVRRHLRGSWHTGPQPAPDDVIEPFNKNAAR